MRGRALEPPRTPRNPRVEYAFIVVRDNQVLYENYFNGFARDSLSTSWSLSKSVTSALVGIAISEGYIKSLDDPVTNYLPELKDQGFDAITISSCGWASA